VSVDLAAVAQALAAAVPYNAHLNLEYTELDPGRAVVRLPDDERMRNHVGSQHAGGLFSAAEAASGGAFVSVFAERLGDVTPLASRASILYTKIARGPIDAEATLAGGDELLARLDANGRVSFPVEVDLRDADGETVASATVEWHVRLSS
jgi:acyl-coenzyme A thioesterase PaaI-like protein